jgi:hypothetical protein
MGEGYFDPWRAGLERDCRTCRYSIGAPDGHHLWCEKHRLVVVFPCERWEREAGADDALTAYTTPPDARPPEVSA